MIRAWAGDMLRRAKRLIIAVVGFTVLLIGVALLVLPGPALLVIPVGLAILATEFMWARRLLARVKAAAGRIGSAVRGTTPRRHPDGRRGGG
jgi:tellurite resistance protein TerC